MSKDMTASEALEGSIDKWRDIRDGKGMNNGPSNCPLCLKYNPDGHSCDGCPVKAKVGETGCALTPYPKFGLHFISAHGTSSYGETIRPDCPECVEIAEEEVEFLKSLRPLVVEEKKVCQHCGEDHYYKHCPMKKEEPEHTYEAGDGVKHVTLGYLGIVVVPKADGRYYVEWLIGSWGGSTDPARALEPYHLKKITDFIEQQAEENKSLQETIGRKSSAAHDAIKLLDAN